MILLLQNIPQWRNPFLTVALVKSAQFLAVNYHLGITASVDSFYEGQERIVSSANPYLQRHLEGITEEYRRLNILNYEMEAGTLFENGGGLWIYCRLYLCCDCPKKQRGRD
jgi:uridine phosphorylase